MLLLAFMSSEISLARAPFRSNSLKSSSSFTVVLVRDEEETNAGEDVLVKANGFVDGTNALDDPTAKTARRVALGTFILVWLSGDE
jgi:hypothetical protein